MPTARTTEGNRTPSDNPTPLSKPAPAGALRDWLLLAHLPGLYSRRFNHLLTHFKSPGGILAAGEDALLATGLDAEVATCIASASNNRLANTVARAVEQALAWEAEPGHHVLPVTAPNYPALLREIPDPPPVLYVKGDLACLREPLVAIVGSRRPTVDGRRNARRFASELSACGLGICSGLAMGIDADSHTGALERQGRTVAVLGTGIETVYPAGNRALFARMAEQGAIITEFNAGMSPRPENFPRRNRIISGLSLGVLVVEAGLKSGSMITARFALEQGRDVFAIPGSIHNPMARGCHRLLLDGARLVQCPADIVNECALPYRTLAQHTNDTPAQTPVLAEALATVLAVIGTDPVLQDVVIQETGFSVEQVTTALVELEMLGLVARQQGGVVRTQPE